MTAWRPLLTGMAADRARRVAGDLARALPPQLSTPALASGHAGVALLFTYLHLASPEEGHAATALAHIDAAMEGAAALEHPGLYAGFSGVAWAAEHLRGRVVEATSDDPNEVLDEILPDLFAQTPWRREIDLVSGLAGHGVLALERLPRQPAARGHLEEVVARLAETAVRSPEGACWRTCPDDFLLSSGGCCDLGAAHGVPGVIAMLGQACRAGVDARPLLEDAVRWVLAQRLAEGPGLRLPPRVAPGEPAARSRLAWCYGDLGASAALLSAARAAGNVEWEHEATELARGAARLPEAQSGVVDAGLCHGAAGVAHVFNRLYQATGDELLGAAAVDWFERALAMQKPGAGVGGYQAFVPIGEGQWLPEPSLLTGAAGIALALLAASTSIAPDWDRMMLVAVEPAGREGRHG